MRSVSLVFLLPAVLMPVLYSADADAVTSTTLRNSTRAPEVVVESRGSGGSQIAESLRQDVARHPDDFVTFETQTAALRFIDEHGFEAYRETERRMIDRGVFGYWRGKTVVVIPIVAANVRRGL